MFFIFLCICYCSRPIASIQTYILSTIYTSIRYLCIVVVFFVALFFTVITNFLLLFYLIFILFSVFCYFFVVGFAKFYYCRIVCDCRLTVCIGCCLIFAFVFVTVVIAFAAFNGIYYCIWRQSRAIAHF